MHSGILPGRRIEVIDRREVQKPLVDDLDEVIGIDRPNDLQAIGGLSVENKRCRLMIEIDAPDFER